MLILIKSDFKAVMTGDFVKANKERGEFIVDTNNKDEFTFATLQEIAEANKFTLKKGKKEEVMLELEEKITQLKLAEQNQMSTSDKVNEIVAAGVEAGLTDEDMLVQIIESGVKFKAAGKLFKAAMEEGGYRITAAKRLEAVNAILEEAEFQANNYDEVNEMVDRLTKEVNDTTTSQAVKLIKKYCKELEIEFPKAPPKPRGGLLSQFKGFVIDNPTASADDVEAWLTEKTKPEKVEAFMKKFVPQLHFAQAVLLSAAEKESDLEEIQLPEADEPESSED